MRLTMEYNPGDEMEQEDQLSPVNRLKRGIGGGNIREFSASTPRSRERDSGYITDNSPASLTGQTQHFTFELSPLRPDRTGHLLPVRGAVGGSESDATEGFSPFEPILLEDQEGDDSAFRDSPFSAGASPFSTGPSPFSAGQSPFSPGPEESDNDDSSRPRAFRSSFSHGYRESYTGDRSTGLREFRWRPGPEAFRHVDPAPPLARGSLPCSMPIPIRRPAVSVIPPFVMRTIGTQTPHEHCQLITRYLQTPVSLPGTQRGPVHRRLRHHSDTSDPPGNNPANAPLPDIIPGPRDRSVSLPDVQALRRQNEIEMGRELRRISDEFNNFRGLRRQLSTVAENFDRESASFPGARPAYMTSVWSSLRNLLWGSKETVTDADGEDVPQGSS